MRIKFRFKQKLKSFLKKLDDGIREVFSLEYVTLDITGTDVRVMSVRNNKVRKWRSEPLADGLVKEGIIREPQTLSLIINDIFTSLKLHRERVIGTITGLPFIYRSINMPDVGAPIDKKTLDRAARKELSLSEPDMHLYWQATEYHPDTRERDYFVVGIPKHAMKPLAETLKLAHIKAYLMDIKPLSLARLASSHEALVLNLEKNYADVVIVSGGLVRVIHSFDLGSPTDVSTVLTGDIANGLNKAEKSFNREYPGTPISSQTPILLSGELAQDDHVPQLLRQITGREVIPVPHPLRLPEGFPTAQYAGNMGLFVKKLPRPFVAPEKVIYRDINLDLLAGIRPPSQYRLSANLAIGGTAAICLIGLACSAYNLDQNVRAEAASLSTKSSSVNVQLTRAQKAKKDLLEQQKQENTTLQNLKTRLAAVRSADSYITDLKYDYASQILFVTADLPPLSQYQTIHFEKSLITVTGLASTSSQVLGYTSKLEENQPNMSVCINTISPTRDGNDVTFKVDITGNN